MQATRGNRVKLLHTDDPHTRLKFGALGTVTNVDSLGTIHVKWDDGSNLGMCPESGDLLEVVS